ncbi:hypothetical protein T439DRAFT_76171 [Meredithblackwellia eburnea MCA 4105]
MQATAPPLSQFLSDIGAASLSPTIQLPESETAKAPFAALHDRLQAEIDSINEQTQALLANKWPEFTQHVTVGRSLLTRIDNEEKELKDLEDVMIGEHAFVPNLIAKLTEHSTLSHKHSKAQHSVQALAALTTFHSAIEALSSDITAGALPTAISSLDAVHTYLHPPPDHWIERLEAWQSLVKWSQDEQKRLEAALIGALEGCFEFSGGTDDIPAKLTLREWIAAAPEGEGLPVLVILDTLQEVFDRSPSNSSSARGGGDHVKRVDTHLARIAKQLLRFFLVPYMDSLSPSGAPAVEWHYEEGPEPGVRTVTLVPVTEDSELFGSTNPFQALERFLSFFQAHSTLLPPSPYASIFTTHLTPPIQNLVLTAHLQPSLPSTIALIPPYLNVLAAAASFEETFLLWEGYLSFLPRGEETIRDEGRVVRDWIASVDRHWARHVGDGALEKVREVIRTSDWEGEQVEVEVEIELPPTPPLAPSPLPAVVEKKAPAASASTTMATKKEPAKPKSILNPIRPRAPPSPPPEREAASTPPPPKPAPGPVRAGRLGTRISKPAVALPPASPPQKQVPASPKSLVTRQAPPATTPLSPPLQPVPPVSRGVVPQSPRAALQETRQSSLVSPPSSPGARNIGTRETQPASPRAAPPPTTSAAAAPVLAPALPIGQPSVPRPAPSSAPKEMSPPQSFPRIASPTLPTPGGSPSLSVLAGAGVAAVGAGLAAAAAFAIPTSEQEDENATAGEGDDAWGFSPSTSPMEESGAPPLPIQPATTTTTTATGVTPLPSQAPLPAAGTSDSLHPEGRERKASIVSNPSSDGGEDAWGLDAPEEEEEEEVVAAEEQEVEVVPPIETVEPSPVKSEGLSVPGQGQPEGRMRAVSVGSIGSAGEDAWGFGDEVEDVGLAQEEEQVEPSGQVTASSVPLDDHVAQEEIQQSHFEQREVEEPVVEQHEVATVEQEPYVPTAHPMEATLSPVIEEDPTALFSPLQSQNELEVSRFENHEIPIDDPAQQHGHPSDTTLGAPADDEGWFGEEEDQIPSSEVEPIDEVASQIPVDDFAPESVPEDSIIINEEVPPEQAYEDEWFADEAGTAEEPLDYVEPEPVADAPEPEQSVLQDQAVSTGEATQDDPDHLGGEIQASEASNFEAEEGEGEGWFGEEEIHPPALEEESPTHASEDFADRYAVQPGTRLSHGGDEETGGDREWFGEGNGQDVGEVSPVDPAEHSVEGEVPVDTQFDHHYGESSYVESQPPPAVQELDPDGGQDWFDNQGVEESGLEESPIHASDDFGDRYAPQPVEQTLQEQEESAEGQEGWFGDENGAAVDAQFGEEAIQGEDGEWFGEENPEDLVNRDEGSAEVASYSHDTDYYQHHGDPSTLETYDPEAGESWAGGEGDHHEGEHAYDQEYPPNEDYEPSHLVDTAVEAGEGGEWFEESGQPQPSEESYPQPDLTYNTQHHEPPHDPYIPPSVQSNVYDPYAPPPTDELDQHESIDPEAGHEGEWFEDRHATSIEENENFDQYSEPPAREPSTLSFHPTQHQDAPHDPYVPSAHSTAYDPYAPQPTSEAEEQGFIDPEGGEGGEWFEEGQTASNEETKPYEQDFETPAQETPYDPYAPSQHHQYAPHSLGSAPFDPYAPAEHESAPNPEEEEWFSNDAPHDSATDEDLAGEYSVHQSGVPREESRVDDFGPEGVDVEGGEEAAWFQNENEGSGETEPFDEYSHQPPHDPYAPPAHEQYALPPHDQYPRESQESAPYDPYAPAVHELAHDPEEGEWFNGEVPHDSAATEDPVDEYNLEQSGISQEETSVDDYGPEGVDVEGGEEAAWFENENDGSGATQPFDEYSHQPSHDQYAPPPHDPYAPPPHDPYAPRPQDPYAPHHNDPYTPAPQSHPSTIHHTAATHQSTQSIATGYPTSHASAAYDPYAPPGHHLTSGEGEPPAEETWFQDGGEQSENDWFGEQSGVSSEQPEFADRYAPHPSSGSNSHPVEPISEENWFGNEGSQAADYGVPYQHHQHPPESTASASFDDYGYSNRPAVVENDHGFAQGSDPIDVTAPLPRKRTTVTSPPPTIIAPGSTSQNDNGGWGWDDEEPVQDIPMNGSNPLSHSIRGVSGGRIRIKKEKMTISTRSRMIASIAEGVLVEALELGEAGVNLAAFAPAATPLLQTFTSILSLYRAIAPIQHAKLLETVPALGMQFANDADWISGEVDRTWQRLVKGKEQDLPQQGREVDRAVKKMKTLSGEWRSKQIAIQRAALMECLDGAHNFMYTSDDNRFADCQRALAQIIHMFERLAQVWKPVMNPTLLYSTLGGLVNDVLSRVLTEIEDQIDISEEESIRLNKLCKTLHGLESLFTTDSFSIGAEVPIWFKFVFLSEFLEASMADILFLFDHRHLVDFSIEEIARLVRALFADSPTRAKNLEHIMQGHPAEALDDGTSSSEDEDGGNGWH